MEAPGSRKWRTVFQLSVSAQSCFSVLGSLQLINLLPTCIVKIQTHCLIAGKYVEQQSNTGQLQFNTSLFAINLEPWK